MSYPPAPYPPHLVDQGGLALALSSAPDSFDQHLEDGQVDELLDNGSFQDDLSFSAPATPKTGVDGEGDVQSLDEISERENNGEDVEIDELLDDSLQDDVVSHSKIMGGRDLGHDRVVIHTSKDTQTIIYSNHVEIDTEMALSSPNHRSKPLDVPSTPSGPSSASSGHVSTQFILEPPAEIIPRRALPSPPFSNVQTLETPLDSPPSTPSSSNASPRTPAPSESGYSPLIVVDHDEESRRGIKRPFDQIRDLSAFQENSTPLPGEKRRKSLVRSKSATVHHATPASIAAAHKKLSQPFRSPMLKPLNNASPSTPTSTARNKHPSISSSFTPSPPNSTIITSKPEPKQVTRLRTPHNSSKAVSKPFKSPLIKRTSMQSSPSSFSPSSSPLPSPSSSSIGIDKRKIQMLEKKLNILKQARQVRLSGTLAKLEEDVKKWKNAAREAAQELWTLTQEGFSSGATSGSGSSSTLDHNKSYSNSNSNSWGYDGGTDDILAQLKGNKSDLQSSWGWNDKVEGNGDDYGNSGEYTVSVSENWEPPSPESLMQQLSKGKAKGKPWAGSVQEEHESLLGSISSSSYGSSKFGDADHREFEDEEEKAEDEEERFNIGTLLTSLGIPKETLGWNDEEEDFVD